MGLLSREQILNAKDAEFDVVQVPEWGGDVRIKRLTGAQVDHYQQSRIKSNGQIDVRNAKAHLVYLSAVDADGKRLFPTPNDVEKLVLLSNKPLERIAAAVSKLSGLRTQELEGFEPGVEPAAAAEPVAEPAQA